MHTSNTGGQMESSSQNGPEARKLQLGTQLRAGLERTQESFVE